MAEKQKYNVEIFVQDFHGQRTSLGIHETQVENWTLCVRVSPNLKADLSNPHSVDPMLSLSNIVDCIHLEFKGKVQP